MVFVLQVFRRPWPGIMRTVYKSQERFESTYFRKFPGFYVTGDGEHQTLDVPLKFYFEVQQTLSGLYNLWLCPQAAGATKTATTGSLGG